MVTLVKPHRLFLSPHSEPTDDTYANRNARNLSDNKPFTASESAKLSNAWTQLYVWTFRPGATAHLDMINNDSKEMATDAMYYRIYSEPDQINLVGYLHMRVH